MKNYLVLAFIVATCTIAVIDTVCEIKSRDRCSFGIENPWPRP